MRNPLNTQEIDGNTLNLNIEDGIRHRDLYKCDCGLVVFDDEWSEDYKMCIHCFFTRHVHIGGSHGIES